METLTSISVLEGQTALEAVPSLVKNMQTLLEEKFTYTSLQDMESEFQRLMAASAGAASENKDMAILMSKVRNEIALALNALLALKRWIRVQVPKIEDGNNFGVSVQLDVAKTIEDLSGSVEKSLAALPGYFESRASAWEKISKKNSKESKTSSSSSKNTGGKDGDMSTTSETSSSEEKMSESSPVPDSLLHLVALDVKWFVTLHHNILEARDALVLSGDMIEKNMEKLVRPKGTNTHRGGMYTF